MRCFHVTPIENLPEIERVGLLPKLGPLSIKLGETEEAVWLFPRADALGDALWNWLGEELFEEDEDAQVALIAVDLPDDYAYAGDPVDDFEIGVYDAIGPECLTVLTRDLGSVENVVTLCAGEAP